jgi:hypothetical protein
MAMGKLRPDMDTEEKLTVRTSPPDWLKALAVIYKRRQPALITDDAGVGFVTPSCKWPKKWGCRTGNLPESVWR